MTSKTPPPPPNPLFESQELTFKNLMRDTKELLKNGVSRNTVKKWLAQAKEFKDPQFIASLDIFVGILDEFLGESIHGRKK